NLTDEELKVMKHDLYDEMMKRKMDKKTRQGIYDFLTYYVSFQNSENFHIFEKEVETKLGRSNIMGTREYLLDKAKKQGLEKGRQEERARAEAEKKIFVRNLIEELKLADDAIVRIAEVSLDFVKKVRADLSKKK